MYDWQKIIKIIEETIEKEDDEEKGINLFFASVIFRKTLFTSHDINFTSHLRWIILSMCQDCDTFSANSFY